MKRILAMLLAVLMLLSLTACGSNSGKVTVTFMYGGSTEVIAMFNMLINKFNSTVGNEKGITIQGVPKGSGLDSVLAQQLPSNSGPDVVSVGDEIFKKYTPYFEDLTTHIDSAAMADIYPNMTSRYHYNMDTTTSNDTDPLYGVPVYNDTTVLYYNKTAFDKVGVICISVPADQIDAFNGGAADANGKTKADYGITMDIPAKGFYRSETPFVPDVDETNGRSWEMPVSGEVLVFNDQIAMNWDEVEDLGLLCTQEYNKESKTKYGYYTEWWFNYSWSVGGDCTEDLTGNGDWVYALPSEVPNYIVGEGKTYTGLYTGTVYNAGETLDMKDVLEAQKGDAISYETDSKSYFRFTVNGTKAKYRDFSSQIADGTLAQLPSTVDAFSRFVYLAGQGGLNVCPSPSEFTSSSVFYFTSGTLAMLVEESSNYLSIEKTMADDWGIAPLPQYKVYAEPDDPDNDAVAISGKTANHSLGFCAAVNKKSSVKDQSYIFLNWLITDGQKALADNGYVSSRISDKETSAATMKQKNAGVILDSVATAQPGDWWYMPDRTWIDTWANPLNNTVRYGKMSLEDFLYQYIEKTNDRLADYKK